MPDRAPTFLGRVRHVLGSQVTIALDDELAGVAPIYRGRLQPVGQIGSLVRIPQGPVDLLGTVTLVGIAELSGSVLPVEALQRGERWLQVQLIGEIDRASGRFHRGVGSYPGLDDAVHFAVMDDLVTVFPAPGPNHLRLGRLAASEDVTVAVDAQKLVTRHTAIVGSTGSGKTSAVAALLQGFSAGGWTGANIVVIDPHGEYRQALGGQASVRSVLGSGNERLRVPFWALPAVDILRAFGATGATAIAVRRFQELVAAARRRFADSCDWLHLEPAAITSDTPVPFDLRAVWYEFDRENTETRTSKGDPTTAVILEEGDPARLRPTRFAPHGPGSTPPHKVDTHGTYGAAPEHLRLGLLDPRLTFLHGDDLDPGQDPLVRTMQEWLGCDRPVSVLDFAGVPTAAAELAIGVILQLLFEVAIRSGTDEGGIGRARPVLVVLEEAHRYLGEHAAPIAREAANRVAREGRKYGVGLMLVTQRPSELPDTALAQCGTIVSLRLTNSADQAKVRHALPDTVAGLAETLPSLRTGEAIASGEALVLPARLLVDLPDPRPQADDPTLEAWRGPASIATIDPALQRWRGIYTTEGQ